MTDRERIARLRERIAGGKARPGDKGELAHLLRITQNVYDLPAGQTGTAELDATAWPQRMKKSPPGED